MTRKEEITEAAREYVSGVILSSPSDVVHFANGAEWADEHPNLEKLWHGIGEVPEDNSHVLVEHNFMGGLKYDSHFYIVGKYESWQRFIKRTGCIRWAYINDFVSETE